MVQFARHDTKLFSDDRNRFTPNCIALYKWMRKIDKDMFVEFERKVETQGHTAHVAILDFREAVIAWLDPEVWTMTGWFDHRWHDTEEISEGGSRSFRHLTIGSRASSKKWRKLKKVAEARSSRKKIKKKFLSKCSKINSRKKKKNDTISKHPQMST